MERATWWEVEPAVRFELTACCLRNSCSATELRRRSECPRRGVGRKYSEVTPASAPRRRTPDRGSTRGHGGRDQRERVKRAGSAKSALPDSRDALLKRGCWRPSWTTKSEFEPAQANRHSCPRRAIPVPPDPSPVLRGSEITGAKWCGGICSATDRGVETHARVALLCGSACAPLGTRGYVVQSDAAVLVAPAWYESALRRCSRVRDSAIHQDPGVAVVRFVFKEGLTTGVTVIKCAALAGR